MIWTQRFPVPTGKVTVTVEVEGFSDEMNRQLSVYTADLIRKGVRLGGYDSDHDGRVLGMEATQ